MTTYPDIQDSKFFVRMNWIDNNNCHRSERSTTKRSDVTKIAFLGWVEKTKGIEDLIHAIHELRHEDISLVIAGHGTYFSEAERLISSLNLNEKIDLVGWLEADAKFSLLAQSDIFVLPSHYEGMPNAVLEAMAAGLPIVATEVGGIPDMINHSESGLLIQPKEKKLLADALAILIDDPERRKTMGANAQISIYTHHCIRSAIKDFETILLK